MSLEIDSWWVGSYLIDTLPCINRLKSALDHLCKTDTEYSPLNLSIGSGTASMNDSIENQTKMIKLKVKLHGSIDKFEVDKVN